VASPWHREKHFPPCPYFPIPLLIPLALLLHVEKARKERRTREKIKERKKKGEKKRSGKKCTCTSRAKERKTQPLIGRTQMPLSARKGKLFDTPQVHFAVLSASRRIWQDRAWIRVRGLAVSAPTQLSCFL
jgi:type III secretory pathway component EscV